MKIYILAYCNAYLGIFDGRIFLKAQGFTALALLA